MRPTRGDICSGWIHAPHQRCDSRQPFTIRKGRHDTGRNRHVHRFHNRRRPSLHPLRNCLRNHQLIRLRSPLRICLRNSLRICLRNCLRNHQLIRLRSPPADLPEESSQKSLAELTGESSEDLSWELPADLPEESSQKSLAESPITHLLLSRSRLKPV